MGEQNVEKFEAGDLRNFLRAIIRDLNALEMMLESDLIESDKHRIGAELEFVLVDDAWRPMCIAEKVLADLESAPIDVTPELGRFNIEMNLPPLDFQGGCFSEMERMLEDGFARIRESAQKNGGRAVIVGILPTMAQADLDLKNMMDLPRYHALNEVLLKLRGGDYQFRIRGTDELAIQHGSVMVETCNTSFQVHIQVQPKQFAEVYNVSQLIAAPVLATCTNSPILFGKRLWRETRIALFQQSMDLRNLSSAERELSPRVSFGDRWLDDSVVEIFREDIARHRVLLGGRTTEDAVKAVEEGKIPGLDALRLHNGTVYRWNRPCYGVGGGKAHLRIENRLLPAGPTVVDQVATAAFWLGLCVAGPRMFGDVRETMDFDEASANLTAAAYRGLGAHFTWLGGEQIAAPDLICDRLLPVARQGLKERGVDDEDADRYLGIVKDRVTSGLTGSQWLVSSLAAMKDKSSKTERLAALTAGMAKRQVLNRPVHTWDLADIEESGGWKHHYAQVGQYMTTDLLTVSRDEAVDLVACMMDWRKIRHVLVEDGDHRLVGLVSHRTIIRLIARGKTVDEDHPIAVEEIMQTSVVTITPETTTVDAIALMRKHKVSVLPVVRDDRLVGIVSERDFMKIAAALLEHELGAGGSSEG